MNNKKAVDNFSSGERLKEAMNAKGLRLGALSEQFGVEEDTIKQWIYRGIPKSKTSAVAGYFGLEDKFFLDKSIDRETFKKAIFRNVSDQSPINSMDENTVLKYIDSKIDCTSLKFADVLKPALDIVNEKLTIINTNNSIVFNELVSMSKKQIDITNLGFNETKELLMIVGTNINKLLLTLNKEKISDEELIDIANLNKNNTTDFNQSDVDAHFSAIISSYTSYEFSNVIKHIDRIIYLTKDINLINDKAAILLSFNDIKNADILLDKILKIDPLHRHALFNKILILISQCKIDESQKFIERLSSVMPDWMHIINAIINIHNMKFDSALNDINTAISFDRSNPKLYFLAAIISYRIMDYQKAVEYIDNCINLTPLNMCMVYYYLKANFLYDSGNFEEYKNISNKIFEIFKDDISIKFINRFINHISNIFTYDNFQDIKINLQPVIDELLEDSKKAPDNFVIYFLIGFIYTLIQNYNLAEAFYSKSLSMFDKDPTVYIFRGYVRKKLGMHIESDSDIEKGNEYMVHNASVVIFSHIMGAMNTNDFETAYNYACKLQFENNSVSTLSITFITILKLAIMIFLKKYDEIAVDANKLIENSNSDIVKSIAYSIFIFAEYQQKNYENVLNIFDELNKISEIYINIDENDSEIINNDENESNLLFDIIFLPFIRIKAMSIINLIFDYNIKYIENINIAISNFEYIDSLNRSTMDDYFFLSTAYYFNNEIKKSNSHLEKSIDDKLTKEIAIFFRAYKVIAFIIENRKNLPKLLNLCISDFEVLKNYPPYFNQSIYYLAISYLLNGDITNANYYKNLYINECANENHIEEIFKIIEEILANSN